jgi:WD40 repeat protein
MWDAATGRPVGSPMQGHTGAINSLSFSDGIRIVSGSHDKTIRVWDAVTGKLVGESLQGHGGVRSVSFSPDGSRIPSGSVDNTVRFLYAASWLPSQECTKQECLTVTHQAHRMHCATPLRLLEGTFHDDRGSTSNFLGAHEWMVGPNRQLLFLVPPALQDKL